MLVHLPRNEPYRGWRWLSEESGEVKLKVQIERSSKKSGDQRCCKGCQRLQGVRNRSKRWGFLGGLGSCPSQSSIKSINVVNSTQDTIEDYLGAVVFSSEERNLTKSFPYTTSDDEIKKIRITETRPGGGIEA
ncbi:hypothetical protein ACLOJK_025290 [Asimina triloba]